MNKLFSLRRLVSLLLVLALLLTALPAAAEEDRPTIFSELTGIPEDTVVMTVGDKQITADLYMYWFSYICSTLEYNIVMSYVNYGIYGGCIDFEAGAVNWNADMGGVPLISYAKSQTEGFIRYNMAIETAAEELGVTMSDATKASMDADLQSAVDSLGGEEQFAAYVASRGVTRAAFECLTSVSYLRKDLQALVTAEGSPLFLPVEDYGQYLYYADHILFANTDSSTGAAITENQRIEKLAIAEAVLKALRESDDPNTLFTEMADSYSEDPGHQTNPKGYIFGSGEMVAEFENAVIALQPGEISDLVESAYGWHIILRRPITEALADDPSTEATITEEHLSRLLSERSAAFEVTYDPCLESVDWAAFYPAYSAVVNAAAEEGETAAEAAAE